MKQIKNKIAFIDVDGTLNAHPWDTNEKKLLNKKLTNSTISLLKKKGYICVLATSRTEEMCMSSKNFSLSKRKFNFRRPLPHIGRKPDGTRFYIRPETFYPIKMLDPLIMITSSGAKILVLQKGGGYIEDKAFYESSFPSPLQWRKQIMNLLLKLQPKFQFSFSSIEEEKHYFKYKTDVYPPDYRIQIIFPSKTKLQTFSHHIKKNKGIFFVNDSNPLKNKFTGYVMPKNGKTDAINYVINKITEKQKKYKIIIIGDSFTDLQSATPIDNKKNLEITFLLVGGSRLTPFLLNKKNNDFAGTDISFIKNNLFPCKKKGFYVFVGKNKEKRKIIIADEAFPETLGPESIIEFLK
jgi:hydroxymethylpyrimidine pyrophosphatase-like HAD family hydrolase